MLRITLAVAGFCDEDLEVTTEENQLVVRGRQRDETERDFIHRVLPPASSSGHSYWPRECA